MGQIIDDNDLPQTASEQSEGLTPSGGEVNAENAAKLAEGAAADEARYNANDDDPSRGDNDDSEDDDLTAEAASEESIAEAAAASDDDA